MKRKEKLFLVALVFGVFAFNFTATADVSEYNPPKTFACYQTYDVGTTTFIDCFECIQVVGGSNLRDASTCTP